MERMLKVIEGQNKVQEEFHKLYSQIEVLCLLAQPNRKVMLAMLRNEKMQMDKSKLSFPPILADPLAVQSAPHVSADVRKICDIMGLKNEQNFELPSTPFFDDE